MSGSPLFPLLSEFSIARYEASNTAEVRDRFCTPAFRALLEAHWITQDRARKISEHFQ
tara:strand:+ start:1744 stop:1917 length:174 start_codon:yes stop_codon:yes gene_type:complete